MRLLVLTAQNEGFGLPDQLDRFLQRAGQPNARTPP
jgi:hypothetical protein